MKIFTATQIRQWDQYTIEHEPISSINLMDRAATVCFNFIKKQLLVSRNTTNNPADKPIKIFCGKGNNGGDGLAIARKLINEGYEPQVYILDSGNSGTENFEIYLSECFKITDKIYFIRQKADIPTIKSSELIIDALFGTGLNKPLEGVAAAAVQKINESGACIVSIDLPSGMYADNSSCDLVRIQPNYTLGFQHYKTCFLMAENAAAIGSLHLLDIGLHQGFVTDETTNLQLVDKEMIKAIYRPRNPFSHKGTFGHALIVAGSYGKMGAAILSSNACLRSGVGLLTMQVPESGYPIIQTASPEAMAVTDLDVDFTKYQCIGAGPGLGTTKEAKKRIQTLLKYFGSKKAAKNSTTDRCPLVLDADGLNILAGEPSLLQQLPKNTILTPHPKEFERLFGQSENEFERMELALKKAAELNCYIILKGHHSFIACASGKGYFNNTGNAGMASGGSGDTLTGILTGLSAQGYSALESCLMGVYLHGLAGDIAADQLSQEAMLASDIVQNLGGAFKCIQD